MATVYETILKNLYENKNDDAVVTFVVHKQEVKAHKNVITDRSEVLKGMLNSGLTTQDGRHLINDEKIKVEDFEQFLKFLYLDDCDIDFTNLGALLHMGEMYLCPSLKQKCMEFVQNECNSIDGNIQCCKIGILCEDECPEVLKFCIEELASKEFIGHPVSAELVERIAKDCPRSYVLTEDKLFDKIFRWGINEWLRLKVLDDKDGIKNVLLPIIKHMQLQNVSFHTWLHIIKPNELAPLEDCYKAIEDFAKSCPNSFLQMTPQNPWLKEVIMVSAEEEVWLPPEEEVWLPPEEEVWLPPEEEVWLPPEEEVWLPPEEEV